MAQGERNFRNYPKDIHRLNRLETPAKHAGKRHISTNPQDSSVSSCFKVLRGKTKKEMKVSPVDIGGNVEIGGGVLQRREACGRQVFATEEVATGMVGTLKSLGIRAGVAKCSTCGLIHVNEYPALVQL